MSDQVGNQNIGFLMTRLKCRKPSEQLFSMLPNLNLVLSPHTEGEDSTETDASSKQQREPQQKYRTGTVSDKLLGAYICQGTRKYKLIACSYADEQVLTYMSTHVKI